MTDGWLAGLPTGCLKRCRRKAELPVATAPTARRAHGGQMASSDGAPGRPRCCRADSPFLRVGKLGIATIPAVLRQRTYVLALIGDAAEGGRSIERCLHSRRTRPIRGRTSLTSQRRTTSTPARAAP